MIVAGSQLGNYSTKVLNINSNSPSVSQLLRFDFDWNRLTPNTVTIPQAVNLNSNNFYIIAFSYAARIDTQLNTNLANVIFNNNLLKSLTLTDY